VEEETSSAADTPAVPSGRRHPPPWESSRAKPGRHRSDPRNYLNMASVLNWVRRQLGEAEEGCVTVEVQKGFFEVAVDKGRQQGAATWLAESHRGPPPKTLTKTPCLYFQRSDDGSLGNAVRGMRPCLVVCCVVR